ncbi:MAG: hypothetical protein OXC46_04555 [Thaumarchaeota archaeon]|nr:hypothetical protein [Nitrososphaerota archaeon]
MPKYVILLGDRHEPQALQVMQTITAKTPYTALTRVKAKLRKTGYTGNIHIALEIHGCHNIRCTGTIF